MTNQYICWADNAGAIIGQHFNGYYNQNAPKETLGVVQSKYDALLAEYKELEEQANDYYEVLRDTYHHEFPKTQDEINAEQAKVLADCKKQLELASVTAIKQSKQLEEQAALIADNNKTMAALLAEMQAMRAAQDPTPQPVTKAKSNKNEHT